MIKIVSWNINSRQSLWNFVAALKNELDVDVALLQEAPAPPNEIKIDVDKETPWMTAGAGLRRPWRTAVVGISDKVQLKAKQLKSIENAGWGELAVSRAGTLAVADITLPDTGETITLASMYSSWEKPDTSSKSSWIYADASAHRLISDLSMLIGREKGHKIIVAGDLNILYGYGDGGNQYWKSRYETFFSRMEAIGLKFVGPQFPNGVQANPVPLELPADSKNVPTFRTKRKEPESAQRQLDFVFASAALENRIQVSALNQESEWGPSDHCRILIELR